MENGTFTALQTLEISFIVTNSRTAWLFAFDEVLMAVGMGTTAYAILTSNREEFRSLKTLAYVSSGMAVVCTIGFFLHAAKSVAPWLAGASTAITVLSYAFFLPIWLTFLGCKMRDRGVIEPVSYASSKASIELPHDAV